MLISTRLRSAGAIVFAQSHRGQAFLWFYQQAEKANYFCAYQSDPWIV